MAQDLDRQHPSADVGASTTSSPRDPTSVPRAAGSLLDVLATSFGPGPWSLTRRATDDLEVVLASAGATAGATADRPTPDRPTADRPTADRPTADRPTADRPAPNTPAPDARHVSISLPDGTPFGTMSVPQHVAELWDPLFGEFGRLVAMLSEAQHSARDQADRAAQAERHADFAERSAMLDRMTGLGNRAAWERMLDVAHARAERYDEPAAIIIIDLDDLKVINDRDGHLAGDLTIRITADALTRSTRRPDWVARLGGDEFGIIAQPCTERHAAMLVERIHDTLLEEHIRASVGVTAHDPRRAIIDTWRRADADMYAVKARRKANR